MVLCSAGDFYGGSDVYNEPKSHFVAEMMSFFQYDAIAVGETDLGYGLAALKEDRDRYELNLVCANLYEKIDGDRSRLKQPFPGYRIVSRAGLKIGFIGLLSPATKPGVKAMKGGEVEALTYIIKDPTPMVAGLVRKVRKKCDVLVLLAHMERRELEQFLPDFPEVDIAVLGHSDRTQKTQEPYMIGTVPVYMAAHQGQYVGRLKITLDPDLKIADRKNKLYFLESSYVDEPVVAELVKAFQEDYKLIQKELYAKDMLQKSKRSPDHADTYLGVGSCLGCHEEAFEIYRQTTHARAYETLARQFRHRDSNCIGCHSVGYNQPGGFEGVRIIGDVVDLVDVQCEACHGPGADHNRDGSYLKLARQSCLNCHNEEQDPTFDYAEAWEKIAH